MGQSTWGPPTPLSLALTTSHTPSTNHDHHLLVLVCRQLQLRPRPVRLRLVPRRQGQERAELRLLDQGCLGPGQVLVLVGGRLQLRRQLQVRQLWREGRRPVITPPAPCARLEGLGSRTRLNGAAGRQRWAALYSKARVWTVQGRCLS